MLKKINRCRLAGVTLLGLALVLLGGCAGGDTTAPTKTTTSKPPTITSQTTSPPVAVSGRPPLSIYVFAAAAEGSADRYYFLLADAEGLNTVGDGHVEFGLYDANKKALYTSEFDVKAADFVDNIIKPGNVAAGKRYEWRVTLADMEKGVSLNGLGTAVCTFTPVGGKAFTAEYKSARIMVYKDDELAQQAVDAYAQAAVAVNMEQLKTDMLVKVVRAGFFTPYKRGGSGETYLRIDLEVTNRALTSNIFMPLDLAVTDYQLNEYTRVNWDSLQASQTVAAGKTISGY